MTVSFESDDGLIRAGRNGRLHVTDLDGSLQGNHPYLSAIAVLSISYPQHVWGTALSQGQEAGYSEHLALLREARRLIAQQGEVAAKGICLDVFEAVNKSAVRLPRDVLQAQTILAGV